MLFSIPFELLDLSSIACFYLDPLRSEEKCNVLFAAAGVPAPPITEDA